MDEKQMLFGRCIYRVSKIHIKTLIFRLSVKIQNQVHFIQWLMSLKKKKKEK